MANTNRAPLFRVLVEPVGRRWRMLTDGRLREVDKARSARQADDS